MFIGVNASLWGLVLINHWSLSEFFPVFPFSYTELMDSTNISTFLSGSVAPSCSLVLTLGHSTPRSSHRLAVHRTFVWAADKPVYCLTTFLLKDFFMDKELFFSLPEKFQWFKRKFHSEMSNGHQQEFTQVLEFCVFNNSGRTYKIPRLSVLLCLYT